VAVLLLGFCLLGTGVIAPLTSPRTSALMVLIPLLVIFVWLTVFRRK
jgi:hypothetical protein